MGLQNYFATLVDQRAEAVRKIVMATKKSPACVSRWISGESKPDFANSQLIANALGIELSMVFEEEEKNGKVSEEDKLTN